jgi:hypothetical protein
MRILVRAAVEGAASGIELAISALLSRAKKKKKK